MIGQLLDVKGVQAVALYKDNVTADVMEAHGAFPAGEMERLCRFAYDYKRMVQGRVDQMAMFSRPMEWTPVNAWVVHGEERSVCGCGGIVCLFDSNETSLNQLLGRIQDISFKI